MEELTYNIITQGFGFLALIFIVTSFQKNDRKFTLFFHIMTGLAFIVHFTMLGVLIATFTSLTVTIRSIVAYYDNKITFFKSKYVMSIFIMTFWLISYLNWDGYYSLLPPLMMTCETLGLWAKNNSQMRYFFILARPFGFSFNLLVGSYAGTIIEALLFVSLAVSIFRFDLKDLISKTKKEKIPINHNK